ncbi:MAG: MCE family protein [Deltaproteobacteria bacterium]|nr:MCE family protein [Deltaproteobacteria bacterium]
MEDNRRQDVMLGLFTLVVVAALVTLALRVGSTAPVGAVSYDFVMDSALGLQRDNRVSVAGVNVGIVESIRVDGKAARLTLLLEPGLAVHTDAKAAVRARTLLGEKYVDLDPGTPEAGRLPAGSTVKDNVPTVEIDTVIRAAAALVTSLNDMTPALRTSVDRLEGVLATADMRQVSRDLTGLIKDASDLVKSGQNALGEGGQDARMLLKDLRTRTPELLSRLQKTTEKVDALIDAVPQDALKDTLARAPATLDTTQQALGELRTAIADLKGASAKTTRVLEQLEKVLGKANSLTEQQIREVLQVEGVRVNLITDPDIERRVKALAPKLPGK